MLDKKTDECLNCHKVGCHGVRHRMCADKKGAMPKLVTECQWCDARLVVKNKRAWLEYGAMLMLFAPIILLEYRPETPTLYLVAMVVGALTVIIWSKFGTTYHLAHKTDAVSSAQEATDSADQQGDANDVGSDAAPSR